ncbi:hypothetical protein [Malaciobacter mytili]|nr:hypothetical protein [Malaciobacter mytili]
MCIFSKLKIIAGGFVLAAVLAVCSKIYVEKLANQTLGYKITKVLVSLQD